MRRRGLEKLWMFAGRYAMGEPGFWGGDRSLAKASLMRAKSIFQHLRTAKRLDSEMLDEILLGAHEVDGFLAKL